MPQIPTVCFHSVPFHSTVEVGVLDDQKGKIPRIAIGAETPARDWLADKALFHAQGLCGLTFATVLVT